MPDLRFQDMPYPDRPFTKIEKILFAQLAERDPSGDGEMLLFLVEDEPYFAIPNDDLSGWIVAPVPSATYLANGKVQVGKTGEEPIAAEQRDYKFTGLLDVDGANQIAHVVPVWDTDDSKHKYLPFDYDMLGDVDLTGRVDKSVMRYDNASGLYKPHLMKVESLDVDTADRATDKVIAWNGSQHVYAPGANLKVTRLYIDDLLITASGTTALDWLEDFDTLGGFSAGSNTIFTAPEDGLYLNMINLSFVRQNTGSNTEQQLLYLQQLDNSGHYTYAYFYTPDSIRAGCITLTSLIYMTAGQRLQCQVNQNTNDLHFQGGAGTTRSSTWDIIKIA